MSGEACLISWRLAHDETGPVAPAVGARRVSRGRWEDGGFLGRTRPFVWGRVEDG